MSLLFIFAAAVAPLSEPALEQRAQSLENEIRCVVCENEPISQSTAEIAGDMRRLVRERIEAGDSDAEIRTFFRQRYGDFVLLRPPMDPRTYALWAAPFALLVAGFIGTWSVRRRRTPGETLTPEEGER
ncbi:MAG: cytochrome c-type biogenesis protein [Terricaulis sp.]